MLSLAKLRAAIPDAESIEEEVLEPILARALQFVETQTHRYFGIPELVTERLRGTDSYYLWLSERVYEADSDPEDPEVEERPFPGGVATAVSAEAYEVREGEDISYLVRVDGKAWSLGL